MNKAKRQRGTSLVELAMSLPLLVTLLAGTFQLGGAMTGYSTLNRVAYEVARTAGRERSANQETLRHRALTLLEGHGIDASGFDFTIQSSDQDSPINIELSIPAPQGAIFKLFSLERLKVEIAAPRLYRVLGASNGSNQE